MKKIVKFWIFEYDNLSLNSHVCTTRLELLRNDYILFCKTKIMMLLFIELFTFENNLNRQA